MACWVRIWSFVPKRSKHRPHLRQFPGTPLAELRLNVGVERLTRQPDDLVALEVAGILRRQPQGLEVRQRPGSIAHGLANSRAGVTEPAEIGCYALLLGCTRTSRHQRTVQGEKFLCEFSAAPGRHSSSDGSLASLVTLLRLLVLTAATQAGKHEANGSANRSSGAANAGTDAGALECRVEIEQAYDALLRRNPEVP